jgi:hypothetical protein
MLVLALILALLPWSIASGEEIPVTDSQAAKADGATAEEAPPGLADEAIARRVAIYGEAERARIERGVEQVLRLWREEDGDGDAFLAFVEAEFVPEGEKLDRTFERFEFAFERIGGYTVSLIRDLRLGSDVEIGPMIPLDSRLAGFNPAAHMSEDLFASKIAFVALLNFPLSELEQRIAEGDDWSRRQWAEARLTEQFDSRVPAEVNQVINATQATSYAYISGYNIYMHHLLDEDGQRLFPPGLRLISHWGLRDELKARYADPEGLPRQRAIQRVFERIVSQEIPAVVVDNPLVDWNPWSNEVTL